MTDASTLDWTVFVLVVTLRLVVPLFIPRFPLPAILAALVIDGIDQTVFATFTDLSLENYQSYDKALDIYYLTVAYLSVLRNWRNPFAVGVAAFLWYYRLVGVLLFELTGERWLLMVFPNTFEYFFIAIEVVRTRWDASRLSKAAFLWTAGLIWVVIKLPQEWWIHVAQLDFTDEFRRLVDEHPWTWAVLAILAVVLVVVGRRVVRGLPPADWPFTLDSDVVAERVGWLPRGPVAVAPSGVGHLVEKVVLAGLVTLILFESYPSLEGRLSVVALVVTGTVLVHAGLALWRGRRRGSLGVQVAANTVISIVAMLVFAVFATGQRGQVSAGDVLLFAYVVALIVTLYDRYSARREACELGTPSSSIGSSSVARTPSRRATRGPVLP
ncbi:hypothetical protein [Cellulomonas sp. Leaf395]|uniref:hypothetical protein n=1 Tax=Cellulomonas sp. Leaf395 TaxID=1736362 RepID=UPI0006FEC860|nr:hypothetical protein [Cellulomonas sp. Leaf395]KQS99316.1 hypothetical protein ASG23_07810 [Cellulomonas sp. Leaf395]